jgi:hypothetical protein
MKRQAAPNHRKRKSKTAESNLNTEATVYYNIVSSAYKVEADPNC